MEHTSWALRPQTLLCVPSPDTRRYSPLGAAFPRDTTTVGARRCPHNALVQTLLCDLSTLTMEGNGDLGPWAGATCTDVLEVCLILPVRAAMGAGVPMSTVDAGWADRPPGMSFAAFHPGRNAYTMPLPRVYIYIYIYIYIYPLRGHFCEALVKGFCVSKTCRCRLPRLSENCSHSAARKDGGRHCEAAAQLDNSRYERGLLLELGASPWVCW